MKFEHYDEYYNLGMSICYFRKFQCMTQQQLADKMDVNYETISRIENARNGISLDMLFELSKALGVSLAEIFSHAGL